MLNALMTRAPGASAAMLRSRCYLSVTLNMKVDLPPRASRREYENASCTAHSRSFGIPYADRFTSMDPYPGRYRATVYLGAVDQVGVIGDCHELLGLGDAR